MGWTGVSEIEMQELEFKNCYFNVAAKFTYLISNFTKVDLADHSKISINIKKLQSLESLIDKIKTYAETDGATAEAIHIQVQLRELDRLYLQYELLVLSSDSDVNETVIC